MSYHHELKITNVKFALNGYETFGFKTNEIYLNNKYKKKLYYVKGWDSPLLKSHNCIAMRTGKINNIIVLDIDNMDQWQELLEGENQIHPHTVSTKTPNGGIHLFFKYSDSVHHLKTTSHVIKYNDKIMDIDIRTNGGNITLPSSYYYNHKQKKIVKYEWINSIFDCGDKMMEMPTWIINLINKSRIKSVG